MTETGATENRAFAYPCPVCRAPADLAGGCSGCGRPPDPDAAEVIRLDREIADLEVRERQRREAHAAVVAALAGTRLRRDEIAARVRAAAGAPEPLRSPVPTGPALTPAGPPLPPLAPVRPAVARPETSPLGVQTLLFVIGGLLLGTGAIVFTVVAWTTFGEIGQAAILAIGTALALAVPAVALWRRLRGTAETFAVIGVLLVLLDGYAAWRAGLAGGVPGPAWAGLVSGGTALLAWPYARWTGLVSPRFAILVLAQPAVPLLLAEPLGEVSGSALRLAAVGYLAAGLAAGNLLAGWRRPAVAGLRVVSGVAVGGWLAVSGLLGLAALAIASDPGPAAVAGGALLAGAAGFGAAAGVVRRAGLPGAGGLVAAAAVGLVLAVALAAGRVAVLGWPGLRLLAVAAVVAAVSALAGLVGLAGAGQSTAVRRGGRIGGLVAVGTVGGYLAGLALWGGGVAVWEAVSSGGAARGLELGAPFSWQLPVALLLVTGAAAGLAPAGRAWLVTAGLALLALAVPPAFALPVWTPVLADLLVAAGLAVAAASAGTRSRVAVGGGVAAGLAGHALLVGLAGTGPLAGALAGLVLLGLVVAFRAAQPGPAAARLVLGRAALLTGLLAWPAAVPAGLALAGAANPWPGRGALAAALALLLAVVALQRLELRASRGPLPGLEPPQGTPPGTGTGYPAAAAGAVHVLTPVALLAGLAEGGPALVAYAATAALGLAVLGLLRAPARRDSWLALRVPAAALTLIPVLPRLVELLVGPYGWLADPWSGPPSGVGLLAPGRLDLGGSTFDGWPAGAGVVLGLALLTAAAGVAGRVVAGRWRGGLAGGLLVAPVAVLVGLGELAAPWPAVPLTSLGLGAVLVLAATVWGSGRWVAVGGGYGLVLGGAGLAGTLPTPATTLLALSVALVVAATVGVVGRAADARVAGWLGAVGSAVALAVAAPLAADLPLPSAAFTVLGVAAVALGAGRWLPGPSRTAVQAAANGAALVALLLAGGAGPARAGGIAALWGAALAVRAVWRLEPARVRTGWAVAAAGCELLAWWLLLASREVTEIELYTLPAALLALAVGWWVRRSRPEVGSWPGYGPALVAAAVPSLYLTLVDPAVPRRLLLGVAAVAVVVAGARRALQAPVLVGGATAGLVAIRELGLVSQQLETWVPLTAAGLLLVGLAATYERRRRDLARLHAAVHRMT